MCRDIVTQSQNLDKIILRNVVVAQQNHVVRMEYVCCLWRKGR